MSEENRIITVSQFDCPDCKWTWVMTYSKGTPKPDVDRRIRNTITEHKERGDCARRLAGESAASIEGRDWV